MYRISRLSVALACAVSVASCNLRGGSAEVASENDGQLPSASEAKNLQAVLGPTGAGAPFVNAVGFTVERGGKQETVLRLHEGELLSDQAGVVYYVDSISRLAVGKVVGVGVKLCDGEYANKCAARFVDKTVALDASRSLTIMTLTLSPLSNL